MVTDYDQTDVRPVMDETRIKLSTDDYLHPSIHFELNFPDFFIGYEGNWISVNIVLDISSSIRLLDTDAQWSLVVDSSSFLDGLQNRASQITFSDYGGVIRTAFFGILRKYSPKAVIKADLSAFCRQVQDMSNAGLAVVLNTIVSVVRPVFQLEVGDPDWDEVAKRRELAAAATEDL